MAPRNEDSPQGTPTRLRDKSFLAPFVRDIGVLVLILGGALSLYGLRTEVQFLREEIKRLEEKELENLEKKYEALDEQTTGIAVGLKWAQCERKSKDTGEKWVFLWETLECIKE